MARADAVVGKYINPKYAKKRVNLYEETNAGFSHFLLENTHPKGQQGQLVASLHGKPNPANPGKFPQGEGGRGSDNPGLSLTCAGPGWSRVKAQERLIQALSSLFFSRLRHVFHCGTLHSVQKGSKIMKCLHTP